MTLRDIAGRSPNSGGRCGCHDHPLRHRRSGGWEDGIPLENLENGIFPVGKADVRVENLRFLVEPWCFGWVWLLVLECGLVWITWLFFLCVDVSNTSGYSNQIQNNVRSWALATVWSVGNHWQVQTYPWPFRVFFRYVSIFRDPNIYIYIFFLKIGYICWKSMLNR